MTTKKLYQAGFTTESVLMKLSARIGLRRLRWSLRRLHCPVPGAALVLEVGAGGNPYPRANVLLDAMEDTVERNEKALITDRPLVLGLCEKLPFKDKAFDFVIASHVLEHSDDPESFLSELVRVAKAGYIETPDGWFEKMCAFTYHRLEVSNLDGKLFIRKKHKWKPDEIAMLWDHGPSRSKPLRQFLIQNADLNHMRFYWQDQIDYEIVNPKTDASWELPSEVRSDDRQAARTRSSLLGNVRNLYLDLRRAIYSQGKRNAALDISALVKCVDCGSEHMSSTSNHISCNDCAREYPIVNNIPRMFPSNTGTFSRSHIIS